jgi:hypothetical protein
MCEGMRKLVKKRTNETVISSWPRDDDTATILWADTGWYRCIICDDEDMGYDGDSRDPGEAYRIAAIQLLNDEEDK